MSTEIDGVISEAKAPVEPLRLLAEDADDLQIISAALQDAIAQAQAERPDLWTPETIERAKTAALIAAAGRK